MNMIMELRKELKKPKTTRDNALNEIRRLMGGEKFGYWFNPLYDTYFGKDMPTYERKIFNKLRYERRKKRIARRSNSTGDKGGRR